MSDTNNDTSHYEGALLEDMDSKLDAILEAHRALVNVPGRLDNLEQRLGRVEGELQAVKAAVKDEFQDFKVVKKRVTRLEEVVFA